jgi:hypothetical protein
MNNEYWGKELAKAHKLVRGGRRAIRLPAQNQIQFAGGIDCVTLTMQPEAFFANLQENAAAFEAWSLALRVWCKVKKIELRWQSPAKGTCDDNKWCHYQRFLYRVERFRSLFPDWFYVSQNPREKAEALEAGPFFLNTAKIRPQEVPPHGTAALESMREADLEKYLCASSKFKQHFLLEILGRQFPVGLFRESVLASNLIFTGKKSAIDLLGTGGQTLRLFELKAKRYIPAGILSEIIFYASVLRDVIPGPAGKARFQLNDGRESNGKEVCATDIRCCKRIEAVLLGLQFHPLIGDCLIIQALNEAADLHWNRSPEQVPVNFRATILKGPTADECEFHDFDSSLDQVP